MNYKVKLKLEIKGNLPQVWVHFQFQASFHGRQSDAMFREDNERHSKNSTQSRLDSNTHKHSHKKASRLLILGLVFKEKKLNRPILFRVHFFIKNNFFSFKFYLEGIRNEKQRLNWMEKADYLLNSGWNPNESASFDVASAWSSFTNQLFTLIIKKRRLFIRKFPLMLSSMLSHFM